MRIFDRSLNKSINSILIFLPLEEATQLVDSLKLLKDNPNESVNFYGKDCNGNLTKKISIRIYNKENLATFEEKIIKLIETGKVTDLQKGE